MNINRHNYEEFFILYTDDELSLSDRKAVDRFIQENPDLEEELVMIQQSKLIPEDNIVFANKESLLKAVVGSPVNMSNYEEWLLLYTDNELTDHQRNTVENFAAANPVVQHQLELFQKTKFQPEEKIVFPNKESLYRTEEKVRVISIRWRRIAAAAVLFFGIGVAAFMMFNNAEPNSGKVATTKPSEIKTQKSDGSTTSEKIDGNQIKVTETAGNENTAEGQALTESNRSKKTVEANTLLAVQDDVPQKNTEDEIKNAAVNNDGNPNANNLSQPTYNPNMLGKEQTIAIATDDGPTRNELINSDPDVTPEKDPTLHFITASLQTNEVADADQSDKKVRGFLRKITRTFEKTTNIKATDDDDRLLVGGLAIKL